MSHEIKVPETHEEEKDLGVTKLILKEAPDGKSFFTLEGGVTNLTPRMVRDSIEGLQKSMLALPQEQKMALETMHTFADGTYVRTVFMRAGSLIAGKIHKLDHTVIIGQGSASVISEEFGAQIIKAPMVFHSRPYVKRLLFIHEDMVWSTVHKNPTNTRDLDILEKELIAEDYEDEIPQKEEAL
jgi:hypothetical protein